MQMIFPYFELAASLFILLLAFEISTRHHANRAARYFARFALVAFFACILEYSLRIAFTFELAEIINRGSAVFWALTFSTLAHFAMVFTKKESWLNNRITYVLLYGPVFLLALFFFFTNWMYARYEIWHIGIVSQPAPFYWLFAIHTILFVGLSVILFADYARKASQRSVRTQAWLLAAACFFPGLIGVLTDEILPLTIGFRTIFPTCVFDVALMVFFIYAGMRYYSLFSISPAAVADAVLETMPSGMIITDLDGRILLVNDKAAEWYKLSKDKVLGHSLQTLFKHKDKYKNLYHHVAEKGLEVDRFKAELVDPLGETIPSLINAKLARDSVGSIIGIVYVIRDSRG